MTLELALFFVVAVWFFVELWKNFSKEGLGKIVRVFFMMVAFIHVIGGLFVLQIYSRTETLSQLEPIFRALLFIDIVVFIITWLLMYVGWTDKGRKLFEYIIEKW